MNEAQKILEESVTRLFADRIDREFLVRAEEQAWAADLWELIQEQGLNQVLLPEEVGGMGGGWADAFIVARACGQYAVPLPVPETMLCLWLLRQAGMEIAGGRPALLPRALTAQEIAKDGVRASVEHIPWGRSADYFVGFAEVAGRTEFVVLSTKNCVVKTAENLAREPRDTVGFEATPILSMRAASLPLDAIKWLGALLRSAQIAGAAAACLELSVKYTSEREQFGRVLSQFQAIQHHLAELAGEMASVDAISQVAFTALDQRGMTSTGRDAKFEIAAAKCRASAAVESLTRISHQVHGAIGFTYEYNLHFLTRRLWSWRAEFGGTGEWGGYLGKTAAAQGGDRIWTYLTK